MSSEKEIVYTDAAKGRIEKLHEEFKSRVERELRERKSVPGDQTIEVTGSDVDELDRSMRIVFLDYTQRRFILRDMLLKTYMIMGILTALGGILYPYLRQMQDPIQLMLIFTGVLMSLASFLMSLLIKQRTTLASHEEKPISRSKGPEGGS